MQALSAESPDFFDFPFSAVDCSKQEALRNVLMVDIKP